MKAKKILAICTHPNIDGKHTTGDISPSFANKLIMDTLSRYPQVTTHNLIEKYPDKKLDLLCERDLLISHDLILLIGPIYWYSLPALAKQWLDEVLIYGWAYGSTGKALVNKEIQFVLTSGSIIEEYTHDNIGNTLEEMFANYQRSFEYCDMQWLDIKFIGGINTNAKRENPDKLQKQIENFTQSMISEHL